MVVCVCVALPAIDFYFRYNMQKVTYVLLQRHANNYWQTERDDDIRTGKGKKESCKCVLLLLIHIHHVAESPAKRRRPATICSAATTTTTSARDSLPGIDGMMHQIAGKERNVGDVDLPPPVPPKPIVIRADLIYNQACADASANLKSPRPPHHSPMRQPQQHRIWYKHNQQACEIKVTNRNPFIHLGVNQCQHSRHRHNDDLSLTLHHQHNNKRRHNNKNMLLQYTHHINVVSIIISHLYLILLNLLLLPNNNSNISISLICSLLEHQHVLSLYSQQQHQVIINIIIIQINSNHLPNPHVTHQLPTPLQLLQQVIMYQLIAPAVAAATITTTIVMGENHPN